MVDETTCYTNAIYKNAPYTDSDYQNINFFGFLDYNEPILDSTKVCYTYIDKF